MLDRRNFRHLLAALGFLACQMLLQWHVTQHPITAASDTPCEICAVANAVGPGPVAAQLPDTPRADRFTLATPAQFAISTAQLRLPPSCGPPTHLA
jgi:hypothetical protein